MKRAGQAYPSNPTQSGVGGMEKQNFNVFNVHGTEGPAHDWQMLYRSAEPPASAYEL